MNRPKSNTPESNPNVDLGSTPLDNVWVKIVGMLQHNWAFVKLNKGISKIYFFGDDQRVFDSLDCQSESLAYAGLIKNGFEPATEQVDLFELVFGNKNFTSLQNNDVVHKDVYSSGRHWRQPTLDDPSIFKSKFKKHSFEDSNLGVAEKGPEENYLRVSFDKFRESDGNTDQKVSVTRERLRQIEAKALRKIKNPRKLRSFLDRENK